MLMLDVDRTSEAAELLLCNYVTVLRAFGNCICLAIPSSVMFLLMWICVPGDPPGAGLFGTNSNHFWLSSAKHLGISLPLPDMRLWRSATNLTGSGICMCTCGDDAEYEK